MTKDNNASTKKDKQQVSDEHKQAMITLWGMAEHRFSIVFNKQHFTLLWYFYHLRVNSKKLVDGVWE